MKIRVKILILVIPLFVVSCQNIESTYLKNKIPEKTYYQEEIFKNENLRIYGKWKLKTIETGFGNYDPTFDYLTIKPFGIFEIIRNDSILIDGKIDILEQNEKNLIVTFNSLIKTKFNFTKDSEKSIKFKNKNKIWLGSPCCDRENYYLEKE